MRFLTLFFLTPQPHEPRVPMDTRLTGPRVMLRMAETSDWSNWRALRGLSRDFLKPWEPEWPPNSLSRRFYDGLLRRQLREWRQGTGYGFFIFKENTLIGGIGLNEVRRSIAQKATLGYWVGEPFAGQGLMTEATGLICDLAFGPLKLHRLEASCLPHNEPSKRLLQRLGFVEEGYAKSYLRIDGVWQDHVLWGKTDI